MLGRLAWIPLWVVHGRTDLCCKLEENLALIRALQTLKERQGEDEGVNTNAVPLRLSTGAANASVQRLCFSSHARVGNVMGLSSTWAWLYQFCQAEGPDLRVLNVAREYPIGREIGIMPSISPLAWWKLWQ